MRNSEVIVATETGEVVGARSIKRMTPDKRWDKEMVQSIKGVPWNLSGVTAEAEVVFEHNPDPGPQPVPMPENYMPIPRRIRINKPDLEQHGYTEGCAGCNASKIGRTPRGHSELCRNRLMEALRGTDAGQKRIGEAVERLFDHIAKAGPQPSD